MWRCGPPVGVVTLIKPVAVSETTMKNNETLSKTRTTDTTRPVTETALNTGRRNLIRVPVVTIHHRVSKRVPRVRLHRRMRAPAVRVRIHRRLDGLTYRAMPTTTPRAA